jgi:hypothetical protein
MKIKTAVTNMKLLTKEQNQHNLKLAFALLVIMLILLSVGFFFTKNFDPHMMLFCLFISITVLQKRYDSYLRNHKSFHFILTRPFAIFEFIAFITALFLIVFLT